MTNEYGSNVSITTEYRDNLFSTGTNRTDALSTVCSLGLNQVLRGEQFQSDFSGRYAYSYYDEYHDLNHQDWNGRHSLSWAPTERNSLVNELSIGRDANADRYFSSTGVLLDFREHDYQNWKMTWHRQFTERVAMEFSGHYGDELFEYPSGNGKLNYTLDSWTGSCGILFQWNEQTLWNVYLGYGLYDYDRNTVEQAYLSMGINRTVNEKIAWFLSLGGRYTTYTYDVIADIDSFGYIYEENELDTQAFIGKTGFTCRLSSRVFEFSVDQNLQPSTGQSQSVNRTAVSASWRENITSGLHFGFSTTYYYNQYDNSDIEDAVHSESLGLYSRLSYDLNEKLTLKAQHQYSNYWEKNYDVEKNIYRVTLSYTF